MGLFSGKPDPGPDTCQTPAGWIRSAREYHADAQSGTREDRRHAAACLNELVRLSDPDDVDQGYKLPLRPPWRR